MTIKSNGPVLAGSTAKGTAGMVALSTMTMGLPLFIHSSACDAQCGDSVAGGQSLYQIASSPGNQTDRELASALSNIPAVRCMLFCSRFKLMLNAVHHIKFFDGVISNFTYNTGAIAAPEVDAKAIEILATAMSGRSEGDKLKDTLLHRYLTNRKNTANMPQRAQAVIEGLRVFHCNQLGTTFYMFGPDCSREKAAALAAQRVQMAPTGTASTQQLVK